MYKKALLAIINGNFPYYLFDLHQFAAGNNGGGDPLLYSYIFSLPKFSISILPDPPLSSTENKGLCLITHSCLTLCDPMDCSPPGS